MNDEQNPTVADATDRAMEPAPDLGARGPVGAADRAAVERVADSPEAQEAATKARSIGPRPASERERTDFHAKLERLGKLGDAPAAPDLEARIKEREQAIAQAGTAAKTDTEESDGRDRGRARRRGRRAAAKPKRRRPAERREAKPAEAPPELDHAELLTALQNATEDAAIMAAVARLSWFDWHDGAKCPADRIPTPPDVVARARELPEVQQREADRRLMKVYGRIAGWGIDPRSPDRLTPVARVWEPIRGVGSVEQKPSLYTIEDVHAAWCALPGDGRPRHPLAPLVAAWQENATRQDAKPGTITNKDVQIMPRNVAMVEHDAPGYYLSRFGAAAHQAQDGQLLMDFATEGERGPTLPAEVWTMGMKEAEKRGAVIALPFRIWIAPVLHVPLQQRPGGDPINLEGPRDDPLTLRRFLSWAYDLKRNPRTGRFELPGPSSYWHRLTDAIDLVNAHETPYVRNGHLWRRRVVTVDKPGEYNRELLDDPWGVTVWLPPGHGTGPRIRLDRLQRWWRSRGGDAAAVRALINLRFRWHVEGKRLAPAGGDGPWLFKRDPKVYDRLTDGDKDAICYPAGTGKKRRDRRLIDADAVIQKLVMERDAVWHDGRLIPPETGLPSVSKWPRQ